MDGKLKYMLLKTVQEDNILPITSVCNMACRFCSHQNNPPDLEVYRFGHLDLDLIKELLTYLPKEGPVIIGESATKIIEGDPFTHPQFLRIMDLLRDSFPHKKVVITTNGNCLTKEMMAHLVRFQPLELNISVNCSNPAERVFLMQDRKPEAVFQGLKYLQQYGLPFHGSVVAMPHLLGWDSLARTLSLIAEYNPLTIRVYLPGFTKYAREELKFEPLEMYQQLKLFIDELGEQIKVPLILEPPFLEDFQAEVKGVIPESPAAKAALRKGDCIISIDGVQVQSRVDAFNRLLKANNPQLVFRRCGEEKKVTLKLIPGMRSGLIFDYDLAPELRDRILQTLVKSRRRSVAIITSVFAQKLMAFFLNSVKDELKDQEIDLLPVENKYFGGSIISAGLLVNKDILQKLEEREKRYELIILPGIIYDIFGNDLRGKHYQEISQLTGAEVQII